MADKQDLTPQTPEPATELDATALDSVSGGAGVPIGGTILLPGPIRPGLPIPGLPGPTFPTLPESPL